MKYPIYKMPLRWLHGGIHKLLFQLGFVWEEVCYGDRKIGLWRKVLKKDPRPWPYRFVFMPGFGDTPLSWVFVLLMMFPEIKKRFDEIIVIDFPGFQGFLAYEKPFDHMGFLMQATCSVLDTLRPHTLLGHSLGAWLAAEYASRSGKLFRDGKEKTVFPKELILVSPSGVLLNQERVQLYQKKFREALEYGFSAFRKNFFYREPFWFRWVQKEFVWFFEKKQIQDFIRSIEKKHLLNQKLPSIVSKTVVIWGEKDALVPVRWIRDWLLWLPKGTFGVVIPNAGHGLQIEHPWEVAKVLTLFLKKESFKKAKNCRLVRLTKKQREKRNLFSKDLAEKNAPLL